MGRPRGGAEAVSTVSVIAEAGAHRPAALKGASSHFLEFIEAAEIASPSSSSILISLASTA